MRTGVRIAVDVGSVRVGVAASDPAGLLATPVTTLRRDAKGADVGELAALVAERDALEVIVGLPRSLSGKEGQAAAGARRYAVALARRVAPVPVRLVDERLSTVTAQRALVTSAPRSGARARRQVVDQVAAVVFLQAALDTERATGSPAGELVETATPGADGSEGSAS